MEGERKKLRSENWFNDPDDPGMTAIYVERYLNYGLTREELQSGRPIIGIAQIGSDLTPCNRGHLETVKRAKEGVRDADGTDPARDDNPLHRTKAHEGSTDGEVGWDELPAGCERRGLRHASSSFDRDAASAQALYGYDRRGWEF